jgi:SAM-dependent methyltransferase
MLRRLAPISRMFGLDRGQSIDRHYIEKFLSAHAEDIRGDVLEIGDQAYTLKFGRDRVTKSEVLHVDVGDPTATVVADLTRAEGMPSDAFDCIIFTQTLQFIYNVRSVMETLHRLLRPGGVLLATVPGISQISRFDMDRWGEYWRFTTLSTRRLVEEVFPPTSVSVEAHGNVLASVAFLHGLASEELRLMELDYQDPDYELLITARAVKARGTRPESDGCA